MTHKVMMVWALAHIAMQERHVVPKQVLAHEVPVLRHVYGADKVTAELLPDAEPVERPLDEERQRLIVVYGVGGDDRKRPVYLEAFMNAETTLQAEVERAAAAVAKLKATAEGAAEAVPVAAPEV